jgi:hypothetical protein
MVSDPLSRSATLTEAIVNQYHPLPPSTSPKHEIAENTSAYALASGIDLVSRFERCIHGAVSIFLGIWNPQRSLLYGG